MKKLLLILLLASPLHAQQLWLSTSQITGYTTHFYIDFALVKKYMEYKHIKCGTVDIATYQLPKLEFQRVDKTCYPFLEKSNLIFRGHRAMKWHGEVVPFYYLYPVNDKGANPDKIELDDRFAWMALTIARYYQADVYIGNDYIPNTTWWETDNKIVLWLVDQYIGFNGSEDYVMNINILQHPKQTKELFNSTMPFNIPGKQFVVEEVPYKDW